MSDKHRKTVIFIASAAYSGSTMLDMMLANHPTGFSVGEVTALFRPHRPHHFNPVCGCGSPNCRIWDEVAQRGEDKIYQTLFALYPDLEFVVDSSKHPLWIEERTVDAIALGYDVFHVLLWKEPGAFAHSMLKRRQKNWRKHWVNYYRQYASVFTKLAPFITFSAVSYEELATNPDHSLSVLCRLAGISEAADQSAFWNKEHHTLFGNDSAKLHLTPNSNSKAHLGGDSPAVNSTDPNHRKVYYAPPAREDLPQRTQQLLDSDREIKAITSALKSADADATSLSSITWSPRRLLYSRATYQLRRFAGRLLGRWFYVY